MPSYNFSTLSPSDFEQLVADLLHEQYGWSLEVFGHGPDGGVDARGSSDGKKIVVQAKHYRGSTWHDLKRSATAEAGKLAIERPDRYIFATSQDLSKTRKDQLQEILEPWITSSSDLLSMRDINRLLSEFPQVERQHFKLWLASAEVLTRIIHSGVWERSEALMEEVQDRVRFYTHTDSYRKAHDLLTKKHVALITGAPGVGKSMLADMLALTYWEAGWQVVNLPSHKVDQCWDVWHPNAKQLFYFDDVFGQTDIAERLSRDTGSTVSHLMSRVSKTPNKRLVITTRTHVLREAEARDEPLARAGITAAECVVAISDYKFSERARIIYNHLYFSEQDRGVIRDFVRNDYHLAVIGHDNFNPRIVEQILLKQRHQAAEDLLQRIISTFERPIILWGPSFSESLGHAARNILMQLASFPVEGANATRLRAAAIHDASPLEYSKAQRQLEGSWLRIEDRGPGQHGPKVRFNDPSCRDFVLAFLDTEPDYATDVLFRAESVSNVALILEYCLARKPSGDAKYPGLHNWAKANTSMITEEIMRRWPPNDMQSTPHRHDKTIASLQDACGEFGLNIEEWLSDRVFELGSGLFGQDFGDTRALQQLLCGLVERGRLPMSCSEEASFTDVYEQWLASITDAMDWYDAEAFLALCDGPPELTQLRETLIDQFEKAVRNWAEDEFYSIADNADNLTDAMAWLEDLRSTVDRYLGRDEMRNRFNYEEQRLEDKFAEYEPTPEDLESLREASSSIDSGERLDAARRANRISGEMAIDEVLRMFKNLL